MLCCLIIIRAVKQLSDETVSLEETIFHSIAYNNKSFGAQDMFTSALTLNLFKMLKKFLLT